MNYDRAMLRAIFKDFAEALKDGFNHKKSLPRDRIHAYRAEGVRVDEEGIYSFTFGEKKEFELTLEPIGDEGYFYIALYKSGILLTEKLRMRAPEGQDG